jgi:hypothetical protein
VSKEDAEKVLPPIAPKIAARFGVAQIENTNEWALGVAVTNISSKDLPNVTVTFYAKVSEAEPIAIGFARDAPGPIAPQKEMNFMVPFESMQRLQQIVQSISPDRYGLVIRSNIEQLAIFHGVAVYHSMQYLFHLKASKGQAKGV